MPAIELKLTSYTRHMAPAIVYLYTGKKRTGGHVAGHNLVSNSNNLIL